MTLDDDDELPSLPAIAVAVGNLCQEWAELEHSVLMLLAVLTGMKRKPDTLTILRCFEFRQQLAAIKVAAVLLKSDLALVDEIVVTVDHIDNVLRPRRNRLVHDRWKETGPVGNAGRINATPRVSRAQAFQARTVTASEQVHETLEAVWGAVQETKAYATYVANLMLTTTYPRQHPLAKLIEARPPRPFPLPQWGRPHHTGS